MKHRTYHVLAGVTDAWLEELGDAAGGGQGDHDAGRAAQEAEEGSALSARRSPGGPALGSDTESEDGLRDYLAAASRTAHVSNDELLRTPTRRAESSLPDRSGTPVARAPMSAGTPTKRKAAAAPPVLPALDDEDDSDGAAPSSAGVLCAPRGSLAQPIGSSPGRRARESHDGLGDDVAAASRTGRTSSK